MNEPVLEIAAAELTPMMKQYLEIKAEYRDAILFFRLGDFYEMFYADAETAARELDLTLTGRGKKDTGRRMPMCGIPFHAADNYILRLINKGYKVAICEQVEDPALAKGLTKRAVIKVITPGTLIDEKLLTAASANYLVAVVKSELKTEAYGLAFTDVSTGEFKITQFYGKENLHSELQRIEPAELLYNSAAELSELELTKSLVDTPALDNAKKLLAQQFTLTNLSAYQLDEYPLGVQAAAATIMYLQKNQKSELKQINQFAFYLPAQYMHLDSASRKNLELTQTIRTQSRQGSLFGLLDKTRTAMGGRLLREWLNYPLLDRQAIEARLDCVAELKNNSAAREELSEQLKEIYDIERLIGRIAGGNANARDLNALKESLLVLQNMQPLLKNFSAPLLTALSRTELLQAQAAVIGLIEQAIVPEPPLQLKEGNIIRPGYNPELDSLRSLNQDSKSWITRLETDERQKTGIKSLKIGFNSVFGYYIEISHANKELVPAGYIRKQTLANAERYITPELKEKETDILNASVKIEKLEYQLFSELRQKIAEYIQPVQQAAKLSAELDVFAALAQSAAENGYVRPVITDSGQGRFRIKNGRHPVIEKTMPREKFTPNDIAFDREEQRFILLFGPNMSGKSTYMRQTALLLLMAQIGSFVPAEAMEFDLVDRLFTRVGAMDDLFAGKSTFMVEMAETANILQNATKNSLILLDEVGRGTSTYDGMAIAWALAEYIYLKIGAKTLFATHYHELSQLAGLYPGLKNFNVAVQDKDQEIIFLHKVVPGPASGSYGVHVAMLAGLPEEVIRRANQILGSLKNSGFSAETQAQLKLFGK